MTREQARQNLIELGIAEPTQEIITAYLNSLHGETEKWKLQAQTEKANCDRKQAEYIAYKAELKALAEEAENNSIETKQRIIDDLKAQKKTLEDAVIKEKIIGIFNQNNVDAALFNDVIEAIAGSSIDDIQAMEKANKFCSSLPSKEDIKTMATKKFFTETYGAYKGEEYFEEYVEKQNKNNQNKEV